MTAPRLPDAASLPWTTPVRRARLQTLQVNLGRYCNIACAHCHVDSGPHRRERIQPEVLMRIVAWIERHRPATVDLTGGAPELIPGFRELVSAARATGACVLDRCNLVVLDEPGQHDLLAFLAAHAVIVVGSLPCYLEANVDAQRGRGTFRRSIAALRRLNDRGYGRDPALPLFLVYNPVGASLPPVQQQLEASYRERLRADHGIEFTGLWCLTNVPIQRFRQQLEREGAFERYAATLAANYNPATLPHLMCRTTLSVDHEGRVYDCDFNLALGLPLGDQSPARHLWDVDPGDLLQQPVAMRSHCLACTAGPGSSCTGVVMPMPA